MEKYKLKWLSNRLYSSYLNNPNNLPVVTIPEHLKKQIQKFRAKQEEKRVEGIRFRSRLGNTSIPIITCQKRPELNHYLGRVYDKSRDIPLITTGWQRGKYKGQSFTIHRHGDHPSLLDPAYSSFSNLGLTSHIVDILKKIDIKTPSNIQESAIPVLLSGANAVCCAETGSGKTLAYVLPLLQLVMQEKESREGHRPKMAPLAVILVPGKELALQIGDLVANLCKECNLDSCALVPGMGLRNNVLAAKEKGNVDVMVSTLGVFQLLTAKRVFKSSNIKVLVIDEADTMVDNSFIDSLAQVMQAVPIHDGLVDDPEIEIEEEIDDVYSSPVEKVETSGSKISSTQVVFVGATIPKHLEDALGDIVDPSSLKWIKTKFLHRLPPHISHTFIRMGADQKPEHLDKMAKQAIKKNKPMMVFANKMSTINWVSNYLKEHDVECVSLHKGLTDKERRRNFDSFQEGVVKIITCTDLGSRGLDTGKVSQVLNYDFPYHMSDYIHRAGRTGRLGGGPKNCEVTSFISQKYNIPLLQQLELAVRQLKFLPNVDANIKRKYEEHASNKKHLEELNHELRESMK